MILSGGLRSLHRGPYFIHGRSDGHAALTDISLTEMLQREINEMKALKIHDFSISTSNFESRLDGAYLRTDFEEIFTLNLPVIMCLECFLLKVEHFIDISESSSDWAKQGFQIEI